MLPMWVLAFPIWLVVFIVLYALATLYFAIRYREARKFLAGVLARGRVGICGSLAYRFRLCCHTSGPFLLRHLTSAVNAPSFMPFYFCFASISGSSASRRDIKAQGSKRETGRRRLC